MDDLRAANVQVLTMGQYLRPTPQHLPVVEYIEPETFSLYGEIARRKGFEFVASGPLVRSSVPRSGFPSRPPSGITAALRWCIVAVGKPRLAYARAGVAEYLARLRCFSNVDTSHVRPSNPLREGGQLLSRSEGCFRLVLDERGKKLTSRAFAEEARESKATHAKRARSSSAGRMGFRNGCVRLLTFSGLSVPSLSSTRWPSSLHWNKFIAHTIVSGIPYHRD